MKHIKQASKTAKIHRKECKHPEAYALAVFQDHERDAVYLVLDCPECGAELLLTGSILEHVNT